MSEQVTVRCDLIGLFSESMAIFLIQTVRKLTWAFLLTEGALFKPGRDAQSKGKSFETRAWTALAQHLDQGPEDEEVNITTRTRDKDNLEMVPFF